MNFLIITAMIAIPVAHILRPHFSSFLEKKIRDEQHSYTLFYKFKDCWGSIVDPTRLMGRPLFLFFLRTNNKDDERFVTELYEAWLTKDISLAVATSDCDRYKYSFNGISNRMYLFDHRFGDLDEKYIQPGHYYFYDDTGKIIIYGDSKVSVSFLEKNLSLAYKMSPPGRTFIDQILENNASFYCPDHQQGKDNIRNKIRIFALFDNVCQSCLEGNIIGYLKDLDRKAGDVFLISIVLSQQFSSKDRHNFIDHFDISFPVFIANDSINENWTAFKEKYSELLINNIVFCVDSAGRLITSFFPGCGCWEEFRKEISALVFEQRKNG